MDWTAFETLSQSHNRRGQVIEAENVYFQENKDDSCASIQFHETHKNELLSLQDHLERYCNVLPVCAIIGAKYDIKLIKSSLQPILINGRDSGSLFIKKANQNTSFRLGDIQLLYIENFLGGETNLDSFLKAYKTSETEGIFLYDWFNHTDKMENTELPPYDAF